MRRPFEASPHELVADWLNGAHAKTAGRLLAGYHVDTAAFLVELHKVAPDRFRVEAAKFLTYIGDANYREYEACPGCGL